MKKSQAISEFVILGAVLFVLFLLIAYKIGVSRVFCYINTEHNIKRSTIMSEAYRILGSVTRKIKGKYSYEDKNLVTTEYFNYYIPANIDDMSKNCGKVRIQKEFLAAIGQVEKQFKAYNISYDRKYYENLEKSIGNYIQNKDKSSFSRLEDELDFNLERFTEALSASKSPVTKEGLMLINRFISQIKDTNTH